MSLAHGPETYDDALLPFFQVCLVRIFYDGRVKKGSRLYRILVGEKRANQ
jgi:hypothetical protein